MLVVVPRCTEHKLPQGVDFVCQRDCTVRVVNLEDSLENYPMTESYKGQALIDNSLVHLQNPPT